MKTIHYYTNTFGSKGHYSFFDSNFGDLDTCITLNCYPTSAMEKIIALIQTKIDLSNEQLEIVHNFLDNSVEGLKIPHLGTGVYNFPVYAPSGYHIADVFNSEYLKLTKAQLNEAYKYFKEAHSVHDDWEKIYISQMDFDAVNQLTEDTIERIIGLQKLPKKGKSVDRFFGAATINGPNDYINNITEGLEKRYFIKGRPGTGKSTYLKKIAKKAIENGFDIEIYHCAFDPNSLDLIVIRELNLCLFDSTAPHEYFPYLPSDEVIDIYETAVTAGTDEAFAGELSAISDAYHEKIAHATRYLNLAQQSAKKAQMELGAKVNPILLEDKISEIVDELCN